MTFYSSIQLDLCTVGTVQYCTALYQLFIYIYTCTVYIHDTCTVLMLVVCESFLCISIHSRVLVPAGGKPYWNCADVYDQDMVLLWLLTVPVYFTARQPTRGGGGGSQSTSIKHEYVNKCL